MSRNGDSRQVRARVVAIVTGGSSGTGLEVARVLTRWGWEVVVVYLERQRTVDATVAEIQAADGNVVSVRADLADELDVQRLFAESVAAFDGVDVVVHTTTQTAALLYQHAARHVRPRGALVSLSGAVRVPLAVARQLRERGITIGSAHPDGLIGFLDRWRERETIG
ncbi:MAG: SDR family NAD(P)-dependent oxidoreductase [Solirubrobacteraceae bacterium]